MQSVDSESIPLARKKGMRSKSSTKISSEVSKRMQSEPVKFGSKIIQRTSFAGMRPTEMEANVVSVIKFLSLKKPPEYFF